MTIRSSSRPAQLAAAALLATGALAVLGTPAYASDQADLALVPSSTQIAKSKETAVIKPFKVTVVNQGPSTAKDVTVTIDYRQLDTRRVAWLPLDDCAQKSRKIYVCRLGQLPLADGQDDIPAGARTEFGLPIWSVGPKGDAATFSVSVTSATADPATADNTVEVPVRVVGRGYDLTTWANDVHVPVAAGSAAPGPVPLEWLVYNAGSRRAVGLTYVLNLPAGAHFAAVPDRCTKQPGVLDVYYCTAPGQALRPGEVYTAPVTVTVDPGTTVKLPDPGQVAAEAMDDVADATPLAAGQRHGKQATPEQRRQLTDVDDADNIAIFDIFGELVTASPSPSDSSSPGPSGDPSPAPSGGTAPGAGGGLPVTGVQVGLIVGLGVVVLGLGALLFVLSRRRRVVLVSPDDERPQG